MNSYAEMEAEKAKSIELWESTIEGRIWFEVTDHLGRAKKVSTKGRRSRQKISTLDRETMEFRIVDDNLNPFRNGMLIRLDQPAESAEALSDAELTEFFNLDDDEFTDIINGLGETNLRRLSELSNRSEVKATVAQAEALKGIISERYAVGGEMPSYKMISGQNF